LIGDDNRIGGVANDAFEKIPAAMRLLVKTRVLDGNGGLGSQGI
jgi:hypothetical protein